MKSLFIHLSLFVGILLLVLACNNSKPKETKKGIVQMTFGHRNFIVDSSDKNRDIKPYKYWSQLIESYDSVLNLNLYQTWEEFVDSVNNVACKRNPAIVLNNGYRTKKVFLSNFCSSDIGCHLLREKNIIAIYDDSVVKQSKVYSLDSFENILRRDIENNRKVPEWCDHPNKLIINICLSNKGPKALPKLLDRLTYSYSKVTGNTKIRIYLTRPHEIQIPVPVLKVMSSVLGLMMLLASTETDYVYANFINRNGSALRCKDCA